MCVYSTWCVVSSISGLVAEYIVAIDVTRVQFPADAFLLSCTIELFISQAMRIILFRKNARHESDTLGR